MLLLRPYPTIKMQMIIGRETAVNSLFPKFTDQLYALILWMTAFIRKLFYFLRN